MCNVNCNVLCVFCGVKTALARLLTTDFLGKITRNHLILLSQLVSIIHTPSWSKHSVASINILNITSLA